MDEKTSNLFSAYESLAEQRVMVRSYLLKSAENDLWLPPSPGSIKPSLADAVDSMTRLCRYADKNTRDILNVGFLRVDKETSNQVDKFNRLKDNFKSAVFAFKGRDENNCLNDNKRHKLYKILSLALKFDGSPQSTLTGTCLGELDLRVCYRKTRILDESLIGINFMLEDKHLRTHRISRSLLRSMVTKLHNEGNILPYLELEKTADKEFAIAKHTSIRYMANLRYSDGRKAETKPISSIIVGTSAIPTIKWLASKGKERKHRTGKEVNMQEPFIPVLSCYRYRNSVSKLPVQKSVEVE